MLKNKFGNKKATCDGIVFDSIKERNYYCELKLLQRGKIVKRFECQVAYELQPKYTNANGKKIQAIKYIADFVVEYADGHVEIIDVKGVKTDVYKLKKKIFEFKYPNLTIKEV